MGPADVRPLRAVGTTISDNDRERAWAELWAEHHGAVVRYATHLLSGDVHAAEDVAQETAIRLWQHPEVQGDGRPLGSWLRRVAHNIVVDRARRRNARPAEVALAPGVDAETPDAFDEVDAEAVVATILSDLPPGHRAVAYQVYAHDRPVADVAADLGIPVGTVKSRSHTALHRLRAEPLRTCA